MDVNKNASAHEAQTIYLYLLLSAKPEDDFTVNAYFNHDVQYTFHHVGSIVDNATDGNEIYVYRTKLKLDITTANYLYHPQRDGARTDKTFVWGLSWTNIVSKEICHYRNEKIQCLDDSLSVEHYFIFSKKFQCIDSDCPSGRNSFLW